MTRTGNIAAVIGLGVMGAPMAANLIDAGYDVVGFNRSPGEGRDPRCTRRPRGFLDRRSRRGGPTSC
jgi:3-hydroxyacyl-CoA dehydrogenase